MYPAYFFEHTEAACYAANDALDALLCQVLDGRDYRIIDSTPQCKRVLTDDGAFDIRITETAVPNEVKWSLLPAGNRKSLGSGFHSFPEMGLALGHEDRLDHIYYLKSRIEELTDEVDNLEAELESSRAAGGSMERMTSSERERRANQAVNEIVRLIRYIPITSVEITTHYDPVLSELIVRKLAKVGVKAELELAA